MIEVVQLYELTSNLLNFTPNPKSSQFEPQTANNSPKVKSKNWWEHKTTKVNLKTTIITYTNHKNSPIRPQKTKNSVKIVRQNWRDLREGFQKKKQVQNFGHRPKFWYPPPSKVWTSLISFINLKSNSSQSATVSSLARNVEWTSGLLLLILLCHKCKQLNLSRVLLNKTWKMEIISKGLREPRQKPQ